MTFFSTSTFWGRGWRLAAPLALGLLIALVLFPASTSAHAFLERSTPEANAVIPDPPAEVRIWFTEPLEPDFSRAQLFDAEGNQIETPASRLGDEPNQLVLELPADLARGTYTIQWRNVSAADGHPEAGFFPFTIGQQADVVVPSPPPVPDSGSSVASLATLGRWLGLIGMAAAVGTFFCWVFAIRPALAAISAGDRERAGDRVRLLALVGVAMALIGAIILWVAQARTASGSASADALWSVLTGTRFGTIWLLRLATLIVYSVLLIRRSSWLQPAGASGTIITVLAGLLALLPFSLNSHAAAQPAGQPAAVTVDWLHLMGSSIWLGGLLTVLIGLIQLRGIAADQRRQVYAAVIPRFSTIAITSVIVLAATGIYSAWLQVGNLYALRESEYGRTLIVKLILVVPLLILGGLNLRVIGPAMLRKAGARLHFARTVLAEVVLGLGILAVVGVLIGLPPAREVVSVEAGHALFRFNEAGVSANLHITPGAVGPNLYTVDLAVSEGDLPPESELLLRISSDSDIEGIREVVLNQISSDPLRFEAQGQELSVVGQWDLELILRRPNTVDWRVQTPIDVQRLPPADRVPGQPPRFEGYTAAAAVLLGGLAIALIVASLRRRRIEGSSRFVTEAGLALAVISALILVVTSFSSDSVARSENPIPRDADSVALGRSIYLENCTTCHGEDARGDGPDAVGMLPPPADLYADHVDDHTDETIYWWIRLGIDNTPMPGFEERLTSDEVWHLVNYIRSLRHPVEASTGSDALADLGSDGICTQPAEPVEASAP